LAIAAAPLLWLAYNAAVYGNPVEFANGPYSAKAIAQRAATAEMPSHPGERNVIAATRYFLKSAELNMAAGNWGRIWLLIAVIGSLAAFTRKNYWPVVILWVPLLFYALSIAYGGVPLFLPSWWPFTFYNVRYGIQLLPMFAVSAGSILSLVPVAEGAIEQASPNATGFPVFGGWSTQGLRIGTFSAVGVIVILSYASVWKTQPACFNEASSNARTRLSLESAVARMIEGLPHRSVYLMYLGDHVGAFEQAGVPLRQVINEGNHRPWKRPSDPEGSWERALVDPARYADFVIAFAGDPVDREVDKSKLTLLSVIHTSGQPEARIYAAHSRMNPEAR
jgi:hypothetical protein